MNTNENILMHFKKSGSNQPLNALPTWKFYYIYEGDGYLLSNLSDIHVSCNSLILCPPYLKHTLSADASISGAVCRYCELIISPDYFSVILQKYLSIPEIKTYSFSSKIMHPSNVCICLHDDSADNLHHLVWLIAHEYNHYTIGSSHLYEYGLLSLLICCARMYEYQNTSDINMASGDEALDRLLKYIHSNFGGELSLEQLSQQMHLSKEYLCRYFKKKTGITVFGYITNIRIVRAKEMLSGTSHNIEDIGRYCGFTSISSFQRNFKKVTGCSPSNFRRQP